jgi:hypothetical protein
MRTSFENILDGPFAFASYPYMEHLLVPFILTEDGQKGAVKGGQAGRRPGRIETETVACHKSR